MSNFSPIFCSFPFTFLSPDKPRNDLTYSYIYSLLERERDCERRIEYLGKEWVGFGDVGMNVDENGIRDDDGVVGV